MTIRELNKITVFSIKRGAKIIKSETLKNLRSLLPAAFNRNPKYSDRMSDAVRVSVSRPGLVLDAKVHIMGSRSASSGTYRLRFFENYPTERFNKKTGRSYGKLPALNFFKMAVDSKKSSAMNEIQNTLSLLISKISQSRQ